MISYFEKFWKLYIMKKYVPVEVISRLDNQGMFFSGY